MTVTQVKLPQVGKKALDDADFFKKLVEHRDAPEGVLEEYNMTLSPDDAAKLKRALREPATVTFDLTRFVTSIHHGGVHFDGVDWTDFCTDWFNIGRP